MQYFFLKPYHSRFFGVSRYTPVLQVILLLHSSFFCWDSRLRRLRPAARLVWTRQVVTSGSSYMLCRTNTAQTGSKRRRRGAWGGGKRTGFSVGCRGSGLRVTHNVSAFSLRPTSLWNWEMNTVAGGRSSHSCGFWLIVPQTSICVCVFRRFFFKSLRWCKCCSLWSRCIVTNTKTNDCCVKWQTDWFCVHHMTWTLETLHADLWCFGSSSPTCASCVLCNSLSDTCVFSSSSFGVFRWYFMWSLLNSGRRAHVPPTHTQLKLRSVSTLGATRHVKTAACVE